MSCAREDVNTETAGGDSIDIAAEACQYGKGWTDR